MDHVDGVGAVPRAGELALPSRLVDELAQPSDLRFVQALRSDQCEGRLECHRRATSPAKEAERRIGLEVERAVGVRTGAFEDVLPVPYRHRRGELDPHAERIVLRRAAEIGVGRSLASRRPQEESFHGIARVPFAAVAREDHEDGPLDEITVGPRDVVQLLNDRPPEAFGCRHTRSMHGPAL